MSRYKLPCSFFVQVALNYSSDFFFLNKFYQRMFQLQMESGNPLLCNWGPYVHGSHGVRAPMSEKINIVPKGTEGLIIGNMKSIMIYHSHIALVTSYT